jgi:uncharacterized coiled-coil protein SlyX
MNVSSFFQRCNDSLIAFSVAFVLLQATCHARPRQHLDHEQQDQQHSQSSSQSQQQPPPAPSSAPPPSSQPASLLVPPVGELPVKRRKVWTNDDMIETRTPADNYQLEKEAKEAAEKEAAAKETADKAAAKSEKEPATEIKLPATQEGTNKKISDTEGEIQEETVVRDKLRNEFAKTPLEQQAQKQEEIDKLSRQIAASQKDLKALQDHLQALREKSQTENPPPPPPPSVQ